MPDDVKEPFKTAFQSIMDTARSEIIDKMIAAHSHTIQNLIDSVKQIETQIENEINSYQTELMIESDRAQAIDRYSANIKQRLASQETQMWARAKCNRFIKDKRKTAEDERRLAMDIEPSINQPNSDIMALK